MTKLKTHLMRYWYLYLFSMVCMVSAIALDMITPQITRMLIRFTRRDTASTNAMAANAPAKAARISVNELVSSPRFRKTTMVSATTSFAPLEMPITKGPAMGFAKNVCSR